ncbi:unnamed protein product, partial [Rhizoctonia solani]
NQWSLAKHFKLHLHPDDLKAKHDLKLDALPLGVNLKQIYSDFLKYLLKHTQAYFEDRVLDGKKIWEKYSPKMEVVIAHPNGWYCREQTFLRSAAVTAGLASEDTASSRIRFVTEAEASVHFCIHYANMKNVLKTGTSFGVCDAGGSTVDTVMYSVLETSPLKIKEQRDSACVQAGAVFVDFEMEKYLETTLKSAALDPEDVEFYTKTGVKDFESYAKRAFRSKTTEYAVLVADSRFSKPAIKTRRGRMAVPGAIIQKCFDTCVNEIKQSVDQQMAGLTIPHLLLVGGFGDNRYVRDEFKKHYEQKGTKIILSDESSSKAVADGAVIWGAGCSVVSRAPRYSFGVITSKKYLPYRDDPVGRKPYITLAGETQVDGGWSEIVHKGEAIDVGAVYRQKYFYLYNKPSPTASAFEVPLQGYSGTDKPDWSEHPSGKALDGFREVCTISGTLNNAYGAMELLTNPSGSIYWKLEFSVCIRFSGTELESFLEWNENGVVRTGEASIILPQEASVD